MKLLLYLPLSFLAVAATCAGAVPTAAASPAISTVARPQRPTLREFIGLNVHTVQFKPDLYKPVCRLLRDYHPIEWDFGSDTSRPTTFPMAANGVDWRSLYGKWTEAGYDVDACLMFDNLKPEHWKNSARDARAYGEAFARYFGPSGKHPWVSSAEVGNEPAAYSDPQYREIFRAMAAGLRAGDPKLKIVTCAIATGKVDAWSKPTSTLDGLHESCDVLNIHSYPFKDLWPMWRRSYPEDPAIPFLASVRNLIAWRDAHAPGKQIWLTEFGYDSATKPPKADGPWRQWKGVSDVEQAQFIVRAFLVLSATDLDRAYLYFFNDQDEPQLHGASGLTRNFRPKPSFYAMSHLDRTLGDYYFSRAVAELPGDLYCFEYRKPASSEKVFVAWLPTAGSKPAKKLIPLGAAAANIYRGERMPLTADAGAIAADNGSRKNTSKIEWSVVPRGLEIEVGESPTYLWSH